MGTFEQWVGKISRVFTIFGVLILALSLSAAVVSAKPGEDAESVSIYGRDVYVIVGSTLRQAEEASPEANAPLFTDSGIALNLTWGQWQAATATATAKVHKNGPTTDIKIEMEGLVPYGIYSVFYGTLNPDSENPLCPGVERTLALTATKAKDPGPDASSFTANKKGKATYKGEVSGDLLNTPNQQLFYFIVYHFDGQAYHPLPNKGEFLTQGANCRSSFGQDAMRHLLIVQKSQ